MRLTVWIPREHTLELNYMWLPTFIGMNTELKKEIEKEIAPTVEGKDINDDLLIEVDAHIIKILLNKFPIDGLAAYLSALTYVNDDPKRDEQGSD